jgi:hypothetical protein
MSVKSQLKQIGREVWFPIFKLTNHGKATFTCPVCNYTGPFMDVQPDTGVRKHALCPKCFSYERHRLQYLVVQSVFKGLRLSEMSLLHFAPEPLFRSFFFRHFKCYETADLYADNVDHQVDIQALPFADESYDVVFASHVLEHIPDDRQALREIRRILKPNGFAILPVPIVGETTIEYPEPNPHEALHVRAPGFDYYDRYQPYFSRVEQYTSDSFPQEFQVHIYEDRSQWSKEKFPLRQLIQGEKHLDIVPVCYV